MFAPPFSALPWVGGPKVRQPKTISRRINFCRPPVSLRTPPGYRAFEEKGLITSRIPRAESRYQLRFLTLFYLLSPNFESQISPKPWGRHHLTYSSVPDNLLANLRCRSHLQGYRNGAFPRVRSNIDTRIPPNAFVVC